MKELLMKFYQEVISKEEEVIETDRQTNEYIEKYISRYDEVFSEKDMERLRDCVYYAVLISEREAFYAGMRYTLKIMLSLLTDL